MLDDCFSHSSVMFPVRTARSSGYKLDMSIVNDFQRDPHALALIKSLVYYCQLTRKPLCCRRGGSVWRNLTS